jgi:hypothetical protein
VFRLLEDEFEEIVVHGEEAVVGHARSSAGEEAQLREKKRAPQLPEFERRGHHRIHGDADRDMPSIAWSSQSKLPT